MKLESIEYERNSFEDDEKDTYDLELNFSNCSPQDLLSVINLIALYMHHNEQDKENGQENQEN